MSPVPPFRSFLALVVTAAAAFSALSDGSGETEPAAPSFVEVEVASVGIELTSGQPLALLHSDWEKVLPIWIGPNEADAIALGLTGTATPRPMTHDLTASLLEATGWELTEVRVTDIRDGTYIGALVVNGPEGPVEVDSRPSDGLALAIRTGARIQVAEHLFEADLDNVNFLASDGLKPVVRIRGITMGQPDDDAEGLEVLHVTTEIRRLDLAPGDQVVGLAGQAVNSPMDVVDALGGQRQSDPFDLLRVRDGEEETIRIPPPRGPAVIGP
ncbi:MAG: hypothetical protein EA352_08375 [Gemmatimonadales bacterium]|nr:MAG: hypothetical protein EA352_08375 [Gemmatimonadales bacterium]